jgi:hypothetical protein
MARTELKPLGKPSTNATSTEAAPTLRKLGEVKPNPAKLGLKPLAPAPEPLVEAEIIVNEVVAEIEVPEVVVETRIVEAPVKRTAYDAVHEAQLAMAPAAAPAFVLGQTTGPIDTTDLYRPRLELSQSVGPLMEAGFTPGQIILAKEEPIWGEGYDPLKITLLAGRKQFIEDVAFGSGQDQRTFNSPQEVKAAGLWTEWHDNTPPPVFPRLTYVALIEKPDYVDSPLFGIELCDRLFAIAEIRWDGAAYSRAAKPVMTAGSGILAKGTHRGFWSYSCERAKLKVNTVTVPVIKFAGFHDEEFIKAVSDLAW